MAKQVDAPEKPTAEERLQLARARHAEEAERLEQRSEKLTAKVAAREQDEKALTEARAAVFASAGEWGRAQVIADKHRIITRKAEREVRRLEYALDLRKRGQAPVAPPPAEAAADAEGEASSEGGETDE